MMSKHDNPTVGIKQRCEWIQYELGAGRRTIALVVPNGY